jgi:hypothetical protein
MRLLPISRIAGVDDAVMLGGRRDHLGAANQEPAVQLLLPLCPNA